MRRKTPSIKQLAHIIGLSSTLVLGTLMAGCSKKEDDRVIKLKIENEMKPLCVEAIKMAKQIRKLDIPDSTSHAICTCQVETMFAENEDLDKLVELLQRDESNPETDKVVFSSLKSCAHKHGVQGLVVYP